MNNLIMHDPDLLKILIDVYFEMRIKEESPPTVPGLTLAIGFNRVVDITRVLEKWDSEEQNAQQYPEESVYHVIRALTRIEDHYVSNGLKDKMPAALVKFTLGAYHNVKEPSNNQAQGNVAFIQVAFEAPPKSITMRDSVTAALAESRSPKMLQHEKDDNLIEVTLQ